MSYEFKGFAPQGWQCPVCGAVYSPTTMFCMNCTGWKVSKEGTVISQTQSGTSTENSFIHLAVELIKKGKTFNEFIKNELTKNVSEDKLVKIWNAAWFAVGMTEKVNKKVLENMDE